MLVSAVLGRLRADNTCAWMRWQAGLGLAARPGILWLEGRAAAETRAAAVRIRVIVSALERMMNGAIGAETKFAVARCILPDQAGIHLLYRTKHHNLNQRRENWQWSCLDLL